MAILGKGVATIQDTLIYTVPANKRAVILINGTNTHDEDIRCTLSVRDSVDYEVGSVLVASEGNTYEERPEIIFSAGNAEAEVEFLDIKDLVFTGAETGYNIGDVLTSSDASDKDESDVNFEVTVTGIDVGTGAITNFVITENGNYVNVIPNGDSVTFTGGTGVGAEATLSSIRYGINSVVVTNPGDDYTEIPDMLTVEPGTASEIGNATLTAQMVSDNIRKYDAIEYETMIPYGSVIERSSIVLGAGDTVYARSNVNDVLNVMVFGVEEIA